MKVNLFFNSALGTDQAVVSSPKGGTVEMAVMNTGILASEAKELAIFDFPFLFANEKESDAIVDGPIGKRCTLCWSRRASSASPTGSSAIAR